MKKLRILFVDIAALAHAAWHAYPEHTGADEKDYRVLVGVLSKIRRLARDFEWDLLVAAMDNREGSHFRKALYPGYKAQRPKQDEDFIRQHEQLAEFLNILGFCCLKQTGIESDDLIGSAVEVAKNSGHLSMILTPDKDMAQLVDESVWLLRPLKGEAGITTPFESLDRRGVYEKYGVWPEQISDWLALQGDSSDNIPGVRGVGPKKASSLLSEHKKLEDIFNKTHELRKGSLLNALEEARPTIKTVKKLTTIMRDVDVDFLNHKMKINEIEVENLKINCALPIWINDLIVLINSQTNGAYQSDTAEEEIEENPFD